MGAKCRGEQRLAETLVGVVLHHVDLTQDHVLLAGHLIRWQRRVQDHVREEVDGDRHVLAGQIDIVHRAVEGGVRIDIAAVGLDRGADFSARAALGPLEEQVLEVVGHAGALQRVLMDAAGLDPHLHGGERSGAIAPHDQRGPIWKHLTFHRFLPERAKQCEVTSGE